MSTSKLVHSTTIEGADYSKNLLCECSTTHPGPVPLHWLKDPNKVELWSRGGPATNKEKLMKDRLRALQSRRYLHLCTGFFYESPESAARCQPNKLAYSWCKVHLQDSSADLAHKSKHRKDYHATPAAVRSGIASYVRYLQGITP